MKESYEFIRDKLADLEYKHEELVLESSTYTRYRSPSGRKLMLPNSGLPLPFPNMSARSISKDKMLAVRYAKKIQINTPKSFLVGKRDDLAARFQKISESIDFGIDKIIVKPLDASLSHGLTLSIDNFDDFQTAVAKARQFSDSTIVQRQVSGTEVRFTVLWGEVKSAIVKQKAQVVGDGKLTIRELIDNENAERKEIDSPYLPYPMLDSTNITRAVDYNKVPNAGEIVQLGDSSLVGQGASAYEIIDKVDKSYVNIAQKLASHLGDGLIAVDLLIDDYTVPANAKNYNFLEFNIMPRLVMYYCCRNRNSENRYDIATDIAHYIDKILHVNT